MASVALSFAPPIEDNIVALLIYESALPDSGFLRIERVPVTFPDYLNHYTTQLATDANDWFAIAWENATGAQSPLSAPIKGGTSTLVGDIVDRVLLRVPGSDENILIQEAEATISFVFGVDNPYSIDPLTVNRLWMTEITNLVLVAAQYVHVVTQASAGQQYTAGLISQSITQGVSSLDVLDKLEKRALKRLGIGGSLIASIQDKLDTGILFTGIKTTFDSSRILSTRQVITKAAIVQDLDSGIVISER